LPKKGYALSLRGYKEDDKEKPPVGGGPKRGREELRVSLS
jgi:hypothetical protein